MEVIEFEPKFWYFLKNENDHYIDVNCSYSFVGFGRLIKLSESEIIEYKKEGKKYLNELADEIQYHALSKYNERNITGGIEKETYKAIMKFNEEKKIR